MTREERIVAMAREWRISAQDWRTRALAAEERCADLEEEYGRLKASEPSSGLKNSKSTPVVGIVQRRMAAADCRAVFSLLREQGTEPPRRKAILGLRGVYVTSSGKYEIGWTEPSLDGAKGKPGWQTIGTDLGEAVAARTAKLSELQQRKLSREGSSPAR